MNFQRAITIVKRQCAFRQSGDVDIVEVFQDAQEQIETSYPVEPLPWFLLTERSVSTSFEDEERLLVPSDFILEYEEDGLWLQLPEGGEKLLRKYDADDLREAVSHWTDAQVDHNRQSYKFSYALTGDYFRIFPTPSIVYTYKMIYYQKQSLLVGDEAGLAGTNRWLQYAPWVLIGMAGEMYAHAIRDSAAMSFFQQKKASAIQAITDHTISRQLANRRSALGETL